MDDGTSGTHVPSSTGSGVWCARHVVGLGMHSVQVDLLRGLIGAECSVKLQR